MKYRAAEPFWEALAPTKSIAIRNSLLTGAEQDFGELS
jgi:hypothetical protein